MTITDVLGGVTIDTVLSQTAELWASTGGGHITEAVNTDVAVASGQVTVTSPSGGSAPTLTFEGGALGSIGPVPGGTGANLGTYTFGENGDWNGTSSHFGGEIDLLVTGLTTVDFLNNSAGFVATVDILGTNGTGNIGGSLVTGVPEPGTWAMMALGFGALAFVGFGRRAQARYAL
jgi:hypothetical protein